MLPPTTEEVRTFVLEYFREQAARLGVADPDSLIDKGAPFLESGLVDSIGFIELIAMVEERFGVQLDLDGTDFAEFATLDGFVRAVVECGVSK